MARAAKSEEQRGQREQQKAQPLARPRLGEMRAAKPGSVTHGRPKGPARIDPAVLADQIDGGHRDPDPTREPTERARPAESSRRWQGGLGHRTAPTRPHRARHILTVSL